MTVRLNILLCVGLLLIFGWLFHWAYYGPQRSTTGVAPEPHLEGRYGTYVYTVSSRQGDKEQYVTFRPLLAGDDAVVVGGLRQVARTVFNEILIDNIQPVVETVDEKQFITFTTMSGKIFFQLFKNEAGEVGSVRFWRDSVKAPR